MERLNRLCYLGFGWYNQLSEIELKIEDSAIVVHDSLDDIADIALDLDEVRWRWENTSHDDSHGTSSFCTNPIGETISVIFKFTFMLLSLGGVRWERRHL
jgi:hypothetical protein